MTGCTGMYDKFRRKWLRRELRSFLSKLTLNTYVNSASQIRPYIRITGTFENGNWNGLPTPLLGTYYGTFSKFSCNTHVTRKPYVRIEVLLKTLRDDRQRVLKKVP